MCKPSECMEMTPFTKSTSSRSTCSGIEPRPGGPDRSSPHFPSEQALPPSSSRHSPPTPQSSEADDGADDGDRASCGSDETPPPFLVRGGESSDGSNGRERSEGRGSCSARTDNPGDTGNDSSDNGNGNDTNMNSNYTSSGYRNNNMQRRWHLLTHEPHPSIDPSINRPNTRQEYKDQHPHRPCHGSATDSLPALPFHSHQELALAERSMRRLVADSRLFPARAGGDRWFGRRPPGREGLNYVAQSLVNSTDAMAAEFAPRATTLYEREVRVGDLLGRGGFCEVRLAYLEGGAREGSGSTVENRDGSEEGRPYALKYLSPTIAKRKSPRAFSRGAADLAIEARFLSVLSHENILTLRHVSVGSLRECYNCYDTPEGSPGAGHPAASPRHLGYFLVLDRLHETLDHRMRHAYVPEAAAIMGERPGRHHDYHECCSGSGHTTRSPHLDRTSRERNRWLNNLNRWMHRSSPQLSDPPNKAEDEAPRNHPLRNSLIRRLEILRCVASAVQCLHDRDIVFRDVKPDNIGFYRDASSGEEVPKLFDFGLVKEMKPHSRVKYLAPRHGDAVAEPVFKLTGRTGSRRYMSPEVAFSSPYNHKADVYSFGVMTYEVATLMQPFVGYTIHRHEAEVLRGGRRPCLAGYRNYWPDDLARLIDDCWAGDMRDRPDVRRVMERLDGCLGELAGASVVDGPSDRAGASTGLVLPTFSRIHPSPTPKGSTARNGSGRGIKQLLDAMPAALTQKPPWPGNAPQA